jgi:hypothetical protein
MNLGPSRYPKITEWDNTTMSSNFGSSEFSPLYASRNRLVPAEFHLNSRTPTPITHKHVFILKICKH